MFCWILYLALKLAAFNRFEDGWEDKPAILFIDEVENHLHPTWQRRVIPTLLEYFPNLQIFGATHSPFVVAGLRARQVHLLKQEQLGVISTTTNTEDVVGWTADEILRAWMEVDEPTDLVTIDRSIRLRELQAKLSLTADEESELNTLRRQVNESLLSRDGPVEPQKERYSDLMQRFLETRKSRLELGRRVTDCAGLIVVRNLSRLLDLPKSIPKAGLTITPKETSPGHQPFLNRRTMSGVTTARL